MAFAKGSSNKRRFYVDFQYATYHEYANQLHPKGQPFLTLPNSLVSVNSTSGISVIPEEIVFLIFS